MAEVSQDTRDVSLYMVYDAERQHMYMCPHAEEVKHIGSVLCEHERWYEGKNCARKESHWIFIRKMHQWYAWSTRLPSSRLLVLMPYFNCRQKNLSIKCNDGYVVYSTLPSLALSDFRDPRVWRLVLNSYHPEFGAVSLRVSHCFDKYRSRLLPGGVMYASPRLLQQCCQMQGNFLVLGKL